MPDVHATLSASGSHRWIACPASIWMEKDFPDSASEAAEEGTYAHEVGEALLNEDEKRIEVLKKECPEKYDFKDFMYYGGIYRDYVDSLDGELFVETQVDYSKYIPEGFGTSDAIKIDFENGIIHVIDLKYGRGIQVYAQGNSQGRLYAVGALETLSYLDLSEIKEVHIHIVQPRLNHEDCEKISVKELMEWLETEAVPKAERAWHILQNENGPRYSEPKVITDSDFGPDEEKACKFCKAKGSCKPLAKHVFDQACDDFDDDFQDMSLKAIPHLSFEEISRILKHTALIKEWCGTMEEYALDNLMRGETIPGWKPVRGRSTSKWIEDEAQIVKFFKSKKVKKTDLYESKLLPLGKAKKLLTKGDLKDIDEVSFKTQGKPTLAPEYDKREAIETLFEEPIEGEE